MQWGVAEENGQGDSCNKGDNGNDLWERGGSEVDGLLENLLHSGCWAFRIQQWRRVDGFSLPLQEEVILYLSSLNNQFLNSWVPNKE